MTLLMHSLSANYNQYHGSNNQIQFGNRGGGSIVITPEARGPDEFYENYGAADVFDVWNDVARRYRLNPAWAVATGYSMGGFGTFKLASQFPDLFARAQPTVGTENNTDVLASLRNMPVLMWNTHGDELVPERSSRPPRPSSTRSGTATSSTRSSRAATRSAARCSRATSSSRSTTSSRRRLRSWGPRWWIGTRPT